MIKNGIVCPNMQSVQSREELGGMPALSLSLKSFPEVFVTPEYIELVERNDSLAKAAVDIDKELMALRRTIWYCIP